MAIGLGLITAVAASYWQTRLDSYWQRTLHTGKELVSGQTAQPSCRDPMWLRPVTKDMLDPTTPVAFYGDVGHGAELTYDGDPLNSLATTLAKPHDQPRQRFGRLHRMEVS